MLRELNNASPHQLTELVNRVEQRCLPELPKLIQIAEDQDSETEALNINQVRDTLTSELSLQFNVRLRVNHAAVEKSIDTHVPTLNITSKKNRI